MASTILNRCFAVNYCLLAILAISGPVGAALAAPSSRKPKPEQSLEARLLEAFQRRDAVELERAARRMGIGGMRTALASVRASRAAALAAAPLVPKSWLLLPNLVPLCGERDRSIALAAAEAAHRIAEDLRQPELQLNDDLPETLAPWAKQLGKLAANRKLSLDVRVKCLQALAQMLELVSIPVVPFLPLLADPEAAVRRSATELFAHGSGEAAMARLAKLVARDDAPAVARAAAAVLCAEVPLGRRKPAPALTALKEAGALPRMRELCEDSDAGTDELLDVARCLSRLGTTADRKALRALRARSPSLRRQLQRLAD